jgi:bromodomain-containing factor 1
MGLFNYPQYVKHPMDLSTISRKLREQRYRLVEEVLDDFQLIWDNCKCYNPTNSVHHHPCSGSTTFQKGLTVLSKKW